MGQDAELWRSYWQRAKTQKILTPFRNQILAREVARYMDKFMDDEGVFIEAGSGSFESSSRINTSNKTLIAIDICREPLLISKRKGAVKNAVLGDIFSIPVKAESVSGIWNIGLMEHFTEEQNRVLLQGLYNALKPGGKILLFWPTPKLLVSRLIILLQKIFRSELFPFPEWEPSAEDIRSILSDSGFREIRVFRASTGLHYVCYGEK